MGLDQAPKAVGTKGRFELEYTCSSDAPADSHKSAVDTIC